MKPRTAVSRLRGSGARRVQIRVEHERQGVGHRDEAGAGVIEPGDEAGELALVLGELVPEGAAQAEVVVEGCLSGRSSGHQPGQRQLAQRRVVDLGVDRRGGQVALAQHLGDLGQPDAP